MRDDFETVVMPLPGEPRQWLEVKLPGDDPMDKALTWGAWIVLSLLLTATLLLLWALPVWRDMDALRNAALRMGQGDLGIRVRLSRIAGIRHIGETFNQMASRISALIENQRSMTNAVSHELRTPLARLSFELDLLAREEAAPKRGLIIRTCTRTSRNCRAWWPNCWSTPAWNGPPRSQSSSRPWTRSTG